MTERMGKRALWTALLAAILVAASTLLWRTGPLHEGSMGAAHPAPAATQPAPAPAGDRP